MARLSFTGDEVLDLPSIYQTALLRISSQYRPLARTLTNIALPTKNITQVFLLSSGVNVAHAEFANATITEQSFTSSTADTVGRGTAIAASIVGANLSLFKSTALTSYKVYEVDGDDDIAIASAAKLNSYLTQVTAASAARKVLIIDLAFTSVTPSVITKIASLVADGVAVILPTVTNQETLSNIAAIPGIIVVGGVDTYDVVLGYNEFSDEVDLTTKQSLAADPTIWAPCTQLTVPSITTTGYVTGVTSLEVAAGFVASVIEQTFKVSNISLATILADCTTVDAIYAETPIKTNRIIRNPVCTKDVAVNFLIVDTHGAQNAVVRRAAFVPGLFGVIFPDDVTIVDIVSPVQGLLEFDEYGSLHAKTTKVVVPADKNVEVLESTVRVSTNGVTVSERPFYVIVSNTAKPELTLFEVVDAVTLDYPHINLRALTTAKSTGGCYSWS